MGNFHLWRGGYGSDVQVLDHCVAPTPDGQKYCVVVKPCKDQGHGTPHVK